MKRELFEKRKEEFKKIVLEEGNLPKVGMRKFSDRDDARIWFNKIYNSSLFKDFIGEINNILSNYGLMVLDDKAKEEEFLETINIIGRIPFKGELYFSDNDEMYMWYFNHKVKNPSFETIVHNNLKEYQDFDLATEWSNIKKEFIYTIKLIKRIPEHGECFTQNGIDIRVIYDKLQTFDPQFIEKLLLHLQTYNKKGLSSEDREKEFLECVSKLGYIPFLQEARFSDKTDMFTWYNKYRLKIVNFELEVQRRIKVDKPIRKINIYLVPNFKTRGGKFYTVCSNEGEILDLSGIFTYEEMKEKDNTFAKRGGIILKQDEELDTVNIVKGKIK